MTPTQLASIKRTATWLHNNSPNTPMLMAPQEVLEILARIDPACIANTEELHQVNRPRSRTLPSYLPGAKVISSGLTPTARTDDDPARSPASQE